MNKRYVVRLDAAERQRLEQLVKVGKVAGYKIRHANMLLMSDADGPAAMTDEQIGPALGVSVGQDGTPAKTFCRRRVGRVPATQTATASEHRADVRRRAGSQADRAGVRQGSGRVRQMVFATAGGPRGGASDR